MTTNAAPLSTLGVNLARAGALRVAQHNDDVCVTRRAPVGTLNVRRLTRAAFLTLDTRATWGRWDIASMYADAAILAVSQER
jgi:hypothetical protein